MGRLRRKTATGNMSEHFHENSGVYGALSDSANRQHVSQSPQSSGFFDKISQKRHSIWTNPFKRSPSAVSPIDGQYEDDSSTFEILAPLSPHAKRPFVQSHESLPEIVRAKSPNYLTVPVQDEQSKIDRDPTNEDIARRKSNRQSVHFDLNVDHESAEADALSICHSPDSAYVNNLQLSRSYKRRSTRSTKSSRSSRSSRSTSTFGVDSGYGSFCMPSTDNLHKRDSARSAMSSTSNVSSSYGSVSVTPIEFMPRRRGTMNSGVVLDDIDSLHDLEDDTVPTTSLQLTSSSRTPYDDDLHEPFFPLSLDNLDNAYLTNVDSLGRLSPDMVLSFPARDRAPSSSHMSVASAPKEHSAPQDSPDDASHGPRQDLEPGSSLPALNSQEPKELQSHDEGRQRASREDRSSKAEGEEARPADISRDTTQQNELLLQLKDEENLSWKEIAARFSSEIGETYQIPALQMRLRRLRQYLSTSNRLDRTSQSPKLTRSPTEMANQTLSDCECTDVTDNEDYSGDEYTDSCASQSWSSKAGPDGTIKAVLSPLRDQWINRAMEEVYALFDQDPAFVACPSGSSSSGSKASSTFFNPGGSGESSHAGRRRRTRDNDGSTPPEDEDDEQSKRRKVNDDPTGGKKKPREKLACPFYKHDPSNHHAFRSCAGPGWDTIHRVKEHIYRRHTLPIQCPRCRDKFDNDDALNEHQRNDERCPRRSEEEAEVTEGIDKTQEKLLRSRKRIPGQTDEDKWRDVYRILFPAVDASEIPSPHYERSDLVAPLSPDADRFMRRENSNRRRLLGLVRNRLERMARPMETELRNSVLEILRDCQDEIARSQDDDVSQPAVPPEEPTEPSSAVDPPLFPDSTIEGNPNTVVNLNMHDHDPDSLTFTAPTFWNNAIDCSSIPSKPPSDSAYGSTRAESFNRPHPFQPSLHDIPATHQNPLVAIPDWTQSIQNHQFSFHMPLANSYQMSDFSSNPSSLQPTIWDECAVTEDSSLSFESAGRSLYRMPNVDISATYLAAQAMQADEGWQTGDKGKGKVCGDGHAFGEETL